MSVLAMANLGRTRYEIRDDGTPGVLVIVRVQGDGKTTEMPVARELLAEYAANAAGRALSALLRRA